MASRITWRSKAEEANTELWGILHDGSFGSTKWKNRLARVAKTIDHVGLLVEMGRAKRELKVERLGHLLRAQTDLVEHSMKRTKVSLDRAFRGINQMLRET